jgi:transcription elongation factor Elf1
MVDLPWQSTASGALKPSCSAMLPACLKWRFAARNRPTLLRFQFNKEVYMWCPRCNQGEVIMATINKTNDMAVWRMNRRVDLPWQSTNKRSLETVMFCDITGPFEMAVCCAKPPYAAEK